MGGVRVQMPATLGERRHEIFTKSHERSLMVLQFESPGRSISNVTPFARRRDFALLNPAIVTMLAERPASIFPLLFFLLLEIFISQEKLLLPWLWQ